MKYLPSRVLLLSCVLAVTPLSVTGCGGGKVKFGGEVKHNGKTYKPPEEEELAISFIGGGPDGNAGLNIPVLVETNGKFEVTGADNKGIEPGKYKITLSSQKYAGGGDAEDPDKTDRFQGAYNEENTPLEFEVTSSTKSITIDLDKNKVLDTSPKE